MDFYRILSMFDGRNDGGYCMFHTGNVHAVEFLNGYFFLFHQGMDINIHGNGNI